MRIYLFLLGVSISMILNAQIVNPQKVRFGKISEAELNLEQYELQADADAVVLFDEGKLRMDYNKVARRFQSVMERHLRIKVLQPAGTDHANFHFFLEKSTNSRSKEDMTSIRGLTINKIGGETVETKLTREGIFREEISDHLDKLTITFPQVRTGSIIELTYTATSDYLFNLPTWRFQREIPTDYTHFEAVIPEYFLYNLDMKGYASDRLTESVVNETGNQTIMISGQSLNFGTKGYRWTATQVPGLQSEILAPAVRNYFFRIDFELSSVDFPGTFTTNYTRTWDDVTDTYQDYTHNKAYLRPRKQVEELSQEWTIGATTENNRLLGIFEGVRDRLQWNGVYRIMAGQSPGDLLKNSSGSSADINYLLLSALRAGGFSAYPVLISTQENGYLSLTKPSLSQFNHLLVYVSLEDGSFLLLDATQENLPFGLLPLNTLNERGRLVLDDHSEWIELEAPACKKTAIQMLMNISPDGRFSGTMNYKAEDYAAQADRVTAHTLDGMETHLEDWLGHELSDLETTGFNNLYKNINVAASIDASMDVMENEDLLYVPAILASHFPENPFKAETRNLPIDLSIPQAYVYMFELDLAAGITVEELPESVSFALPDGKARYSIRFTEMNGDVHIIEKLDIKETIYYTQEYPALKTFLDLIVEQQQATLVLRKGD